MANVQVVRTRQTHATTIINETQSIQLVQTMLHGALSTLTYLRDLFPEKAFEYRYYEMRETPLPYKDFAAARMPSFKNQADPHSTKVPVLVRDRSNRANFFLDWLEKAVFPEIESGELRAVKLLIHPDKTSRDKVLETYTFTIHYTVSETGKRTASGLAASSSGKSAATTKATNIALQQLLRSVDSLCQDLPALPDGRLISIELIHDDYDGEARIPKSVEGFVPSKGGSELSFPKTEGLQVGTNSMKFTTGCHDTILKITGLQNGNASHPGQARDVPSNIDFSSSVSRYHDVVPMPRPPTTRQVGAPGRGATRLSDSEGLEQDQLVGPQGSGTQNMERQSSLISSMNGDLKDMMQPEHITQGDTQTQGAFRRSHFEDAVTETPSSLRAPSFRSSHPQTPVTTDTFPLLSGTQQYIAARTPYLKRTADALASEAGGRTESGQLVLCQCGCQKDEGDMVQCSYCSTWQHLHCYGYTGNEDPRLPGEHVCYWCLLGDTDVDNYNNLQRLAVERRAVFHVAESGLRTRTDLSKALGVSHDRAGELHTMIRKNKFVVDAEKSHKPGYRATGKALFVPVHDNATMRKLLETYFNPMTHINHHYGARVANGSIANEMQTNMRLLRAMAVDLPPPATRHRSKRKATAADDIYLLSAEPPLTSAFDTRTSQAFVATSSTLRHTPAVKTRRQTRTSKRTLDVEEADSNDSERFVTPKTDRHHFTTLQSAFMIDANDKSSPYVQQ